jgi:hypothetical protein
MIIHYVYISNAYDQQTLIIGSARKKTLLPHIYDSFRHNAGQLGHLICFERVTILILPVLQKNYI